MKRMATKEEELKGQERDNLAPGFCCFPNIFPACCGAKGPVLQHKGVSPAQMSSKDAKKKKKHIFSHQSLLSFIHFLNLLIFLLNLLGGKFFDEEQPGERRWQTEGRGTANTGQHRSGHISCNQLKVVWPARTLKIHQFISIQSAFFSVYAELPP